MRLDFFNFVYPVRVLLGALLYGARERSKAHNKSIHKHLETLISPNFCLKSYAVFINFASSHLKTTFCKFYLYLMFCKRSPKNQNKMLKFVKHSRAQIALLLKSPRSDVSEKESASAGFGFSIGGRCI
jgi:hypothetical protein